MSFLLLKSKPRSSRPTSTYRMNQRSSNDRNPTIASKNSSNSQSSSSRYIDAGGGQVQLQRPQRQQQRQISKHDQQGQHTQQQQQNSNDVVISMDEGKWDITFLR